MRHTNKTVTVYRKAWDTEKGVDTYLGTVLENVSFFSKIATTASTEGLTDACEAVLRIPLEVYPDGLVIKNGDKVCEGALEKATESLADIECEYLHTVVGITRNTDGHGPHVKVVCK